MTMTRVMLALTLALMALPCEAAPTAEEIIDDFFGPTRFRTVPSPTPAR